MLFASRQMQYNERYGSAFLVLENAFWPNFLRISYFQNSKTNSKAVDVTFFK